MYRSLHEFIRRLESEGELRRVAVRVSTDGEIAEITDRMAKRGDGGVALLFEHTDRPFPVATNLFGSARRMALALGARSLEQVQERLARLGDRLTAPADRLGDRLRMLPLLGTASRWLPHRTAGRGACQQVVLRGEEADLDRLPILKCWPADGDRFVTLPLVHTVDPQTGHRNVGMYRMQRLDAHSTAMHWHVHKTGARHFEAWRRAGRRMPVAVALGGDPVYTYAATAPLPDDVDEYLLAGVLRSRPVRLVRCLTNALWVPADCDFVIEGYVDPSEPLVTEGPFGDHTGFYSLEDRYPRLHVTAITHRSDALYPATLVGIPPEEDAWFMRATERIFLEPIRRVVQPEVCDLSMPFAGVAHNLALVALENRYAGQAHKVASALWGAGQMMFNKYLFLAPAGTDLRSPHAVAHLVRRIDPRHDLIRSEGVLDVLDHATATPGFGGKLALDATRAAARPEPALHVGLLPMEGVETDERLLAEWGVLVMRTQAGVTVAPLLEEGRLEGVPFLVLLDAATASLHPLEWLWLALANSDPRRDAWLTAAGTLVLDGRSKQPGAEGYPVRFPNAVCASADIISRVDARWPEYGLGESISSPSRRYAVLLHSEGAAW